MTTASISKSALNNEGSKLLDYIVMKTNRELHQLLPSLPSNTNNGLNKHYMIMYTQYKVPVAYRFLDRFIDDLAKTSFDYKGLESLNIRITILQVTSKHQLKLDKIRLDAGQHCILKQYILKNEYLNKDYIESKLKNNHPYIIEEVPKQPEQPPLTVQEYAEFESGNPSKQEIEPQVLYEMPVEPLPHAVNQQIQEVSKTTSMISTIAKVKEVFTNTDKFQKVSIICERCIVGSDNQQANGKHRTTANGAPSRDFLHIYVNGKYSQTYTIGDLFGFLASTVAINPIAISEIRTVVTSHGEFEPPEKF